MYARITTIHSPKERMDKGIERIQKEILPEMQKLEGFRGLIGLVQRSSNMGLTISLWADEEAMRRSEDAGGLLRQKAAEAMKADTEPMVNRYEVSFLEIAGGAETQ
jgi:hypothetical protein